MRLCLLLPMFCNNNNIYQLIYNPPVYTTWMLFISTDASQLMFALTLFSTHQATYLALRSTAYQLSHDPQLIQSDLSSSPSLQTAQAPPATSLGLACGSEIFSIKSIELVSKDTSKILLIIPRVIICSLMRRDCNLITAYLLV